MKREKCYKQYVDLLKGNAMILVIAAHTLSLNTYVNAVISSLHNSSFYFASGILFFSTIKELKNGEVSAGDVLKKKLTGIIGPFLIWTFLYGFCRFFLSLFYLFVLCVGGGLTRK